MFTLTYMLLVGLLWIFCIICILFFLNTLKTMCIEYCLIEDVDSDDENALYINNPTSYVVVNPNNSINIATTYD